MKIWILLFLVAWASLGLFLLYINKEEPVMGSGEIEEGVDVFIAIDSWIAEDESSGTFTTPYWMKDESIVDYVDEMDHRHEQRITPSEEVLLSFFAQSQIGSPSQITTYLNFGKKNDDFKNLSLQELDKIDQMLIDFANGVTKDKTIEELYVSHPKNEAKNEVWFDILVKYNGNEKYIIDDIPLVFHEESKSWGIDLTLSDIVSLVESAQRTEESPRVD